jgi:hypothetical protein
MKMYCITIYDEHYDKINKLGYLPVGLGKNIKSKSFLSDYEGQNISDKNPYYGEYTFHYWLWKNKVNFQKNEWIGFCQYRKFWSINNQENELTNLSNLDEIVIKEIPKKYDNFESILGEPLFINKFKFSKFLKKNLKKIIKNPSLFFDKNKRNIKFHFDLMHGEGNLDKAIALLEKNDQKDFKDFVNSEVSFNPHNMFICKSYKILNNYYSSLFPWLKRCEKEFGFQLEGYGLKRIYGFLAERYMSFWFKKYTKYSTMPIIFKDITKII